MTEFQCSNCNAVVRVDQSALDEQYVDFFDDCGECGLGRACWTPVDEERLPESILEDAQNIVEDRENTHGTVYETHSAIADLLEVFVRHKFGAEIEPTAADAADLVNMCLKGGRKLTSERNRDTHVDAAGYEHCAWECHMEETED